MAAPNPQPPPPPALPQPDFGRVSTAFQDISTAADNISTATDTLGLELRRLSNLQPLAFNQLVLDQLTLMNQNFARLEQRLTHNQNDTTKLHNNQRVLGNSTATLLPLRDPATGLVIQNCPNTTAQIRTLSNQRAVQLLTILQIPVPATLAERRNALCSAFFLG